MNTKEKHDVAPRASGLEGVVVADTRLSEVDGEKGRLTVAGHVKREDLRSTCAPYCSQRSVDGVETLWVAAGISAAVGVVSLGVATYLWISPSSGPMRNRAAVWLAPLHRGVSVGGRFD